MNTLSSKQINILSALAANRGWMTREEMEPHAGLKGFSKALGTPTRIVSGGTLEALRYVERLDEHTPFRYRITAAGLNALTDKTATVPNKTAARRPQATVSQPPENAQVPAVTDIEDSPTLDVLDRKLKTLFGLKTLGRPFVCEGPPIGCQVAEVGINPGTPTPFWPFWNTASGFNKNAWLQAYREQHGRLKPTRDRIEVLCEALRPQRCIELNVYPTYSASEATLASSDRSTAH